MVNKPSVKQFPCVLDRRLAAMLGVLDLSESFARHALHRA